jgi:hypothetical protein
MPRNNTITFERRELASDTNSSDVASFRQKLSAGEEELLSELAHALRTIRYGSIAVTLHDGRIVEIQRTERIRRGGNKGNSGSTSHE